VCRQPRYPQKIPEDRRFCAPALRRVCLCQQSACWPRSTHARWTDTVRDLRSSPLPGVIAGLYGVGSVSSPEKGRPAGMCRTLATASTERPVELRLARRATFWISARYAAG
jgi:hypothetical protein